MGRRSCGVNTTRRKTQSLQQAEQSSGQGRAGQETERLISPSRSQVRSMVDSRAEVMEALKVLLQKSRTEL